MKRGAVRATLLVLLIVGPLVLRPSAGTIIAGEGQAQEQGRQAPSYSPPPFSADNQALLASADEPAVRWLDPLDEVGRQRAAIVKQVLARSRLLEDARFELPAGLYREYLRATGQAPGEPSDAPVPLSAEAGTYRVTLNEAGEIRLKAEVTLRVFDPRGAGRVAVLRAGPAWENVTVDGKAAQLPTVGGWLRWEAAAGEHTVAAEAPLGKAASAASGRGGEVALDIPRTARTVAHFDAPGAWAVQADDLYPPTTGAAGGTHAALPLSPRQTLLVRYGPPQGRAEHAARYTVRGDVAWNLDVVQQVTAVLHVTIAGGPSDRIELLVPGSAARLKVEGPDVREVQASAGRATVHLRGKVLGTVGLRVNYEMPLGEGDTRSFERLGVEGGHWEGGALAVSAGSDRELLAGASTGLRELPISDLPRSTAAILPGACGLAYAIEGREWSLSAQELSLGQFALTQSIADLAHYEVFLDRDGSTLVRVRYEVRNRRQQFLTLTLPEGSAVLLARVNEKSCPLSPAGRPSSAAGGASKWLLPLERSRASVKGLVSFPVDVVYACRTAPLRAGAGRTELPLPAIDLPIAYGWCEAYVPREMTVKKWTGPFAAVDRFTSETAKASLDYGYGELAEGYKLEDRPEYKAPPPPPPSPSPRPFTNTGQTREPSKTPILGDVPVLGNLATNAGKVRDEANATNLILVKPKIIIHREEEDRQFPGLNAGDGAAAATQPAYPVGPYMQKFPTNAMTQQQAQATLARNYYRVGKEAYDKGDYASAVESFKKVQELAPGSTEAQNATLFTSNAGVLFDKGGKGGGGAGGQSQGQGQAPTGQAEQAAALQVKKEQSQQYLSLATQQRSFVETGKEALAQGKLAEGRAKMEVVKALGEQVLANDPGNLEVRQRTELAKQELADLQKQTASQTSEQWKQLDQLRASGQYDEALDVARRIRQTEGDNRRIQDAMQELAVAATHEKNVKDEIRNKKLLLEQLVEENRRAKEAISSLAVDGHVTGGGKADAGIVSGNNSYTGGGSTFGSATLGGMTKAGAGTVILHDGAPTYGARQDVDGNGASDVGGRLAPKGAKESADDELSQLNARILGLQNELTDRHRKMRPDLAGVQGSGGPVPGAPAPVAAVWAARGGGPLSSAQPSAPAQSSTLPQVEVFTLSSGKAADVAEKVKELLPARQSARLAPGAIVVKADPSTNSLVVSARPEDMDKVREALRSLDVPPAEPSGPWDYSRRPAETPRPGTAPPNESEQGFGVSMGPDLTATDRLGRAVTGTGFVNIPQGPGRPAQGGQGPAARFTGGAGDVLTDRGDGNSALWQANRGAVTLGGGTLIVSGAGAAGGSGPAGGDQLRSDDRLAASRPRSDLIRQTIGAATDDTDRFLAADRIVLRSGPKGRAEIEMDVALDRAKEAIARGRTDEDFQAANAAISEAEIHLSNARSQLSGGEGARYLARIEQARRDVEMEHSVWQREAVVKSARETDRAERERLSREGDLSRRELLSYKSDAIAAIRRKDYAEAVNLLDRVLRIDPSDESARDQKYMVEQMMLLQREKGRTLVDRAERQKDLIEIREAETPWTETLRYPTDWREITARPGPRGGAKAPAAEPEPEDPTLQKFHRRLAEVKFQDNELKTVLEWFESVADVKMHAKWAALETAGIQMTTPVKSVHLTDVTAERALRAVLDDVGGATPLGFVVDEGVVTISTRDDLSGAKYRKTQVYDIRDLIVTVPSFEGPRMDLNVAGAGNNNANGGGGLFAGNREIAPDTAALNRAQIVEQISKLIARTVDRDSWSDAYGSGSVGSIREMNGQLVVTQTAENQRAVADLIRKLREAKSVKDGRIVREEEELLFPGRPGSAEAVHADSTARSRLARKISEAKFQDIELKLVFEWFQAVSNQSIHVKWAALEMEGVLPTTPVKNVALKEVTVEAALQAVLRDVGGDKLGFVLDEGVVTVSTRDDLSGGRYRRTLVYDASQLGPSATGLSREQFLNQLGRMIVTTVDKDSWSDPWGSGTVGSLTITGEQLVITQTQRNLEAVSALLDRLRESRWAGWQAETAGRDAQPLDEGRTTAIYDVRDLLVTVPGFDGPRLNLKAYAEKVGPAGATGGNAPAGMPERDRIVRQITGLIQGTVGKGSWAGEKDGAEDGGKVGSISEMNGQLVVTQTADNQRAVADLIRQLHEVGGPQVEQGGNIARQKSSGILNQGPFEVAVNANDSGGAVNVNSASAQTLDAVQAGQFNDFLRRNYDWARQGNIRTVADPATGAALTTPLQGDNVWQRQLRPQLVQDLQKAVNVPDGGTLLLGGQRARGVPAQQTGGTFLDDIQVDYLIQATQRNAGAQLGAGQLTVFNGQRAYVAFDAQQGFVSGLTPEFGDFSRREASAAYAPTGTVLDVEGTVSADRRYVAMNVRPQSSQVQGFTQYSTPVLVDDSGSIVNKLQYNMGQKVGVNSKNFLGDARSAAALGVNWKQGRNSLQYAVVDEAVLRSLLEQDAEARRRGAFVDENGRLQETVVGTDALLANGMLGNVSFAGEKGNNLDVADNDIHLPHNKVLLVESGGYLTAVKAGAMQHWTERLAPVTFAEVPQTIEPPRVGKLVKFEKRLLEPTDRMVIGIEYTLEP